jgi:hypothetical protein
MYGLEYRIAPCRSCTAVDDVAVGNGYVAEDAQAASAKSSRTAGGDLRMLHAYVAPTRGIRRGPDKGSHSKLVK